MTMIGVCIAYDNFFVHLGIVEKVSVCGLSLDDRLFLEEWCYLNSKKTSCNNLLFTVVIKTKEQKITESVSDRVKFGCIVTFSRVR